MRRSQLRKGIFLISSITLAASVSLLVACGDDDSGGGTTKQDAGGGQDSGGGDSSNATTGTISGDATYQGAKKGPLIIAVLKDQPVPGKPPTSPPVGVGSNESPNWPGNNTFTVKNVPPGTFWVAAYIMVGTEHRMGAQQGDPVSMPPKQVTITAGQTANVSLNLGDVQPPNDGGDGGDAGDDGGDGGDGG